MSDSKIQVKFGIVEFSGEGAPDWLSSQLDKILEKVPEFLKIGLANPEISGKTPNQEEELRKKGSEKTPPNLAVFLKEKDATTKQVRKFLATAAFLQLTGKNRINTEDVTEALRKANQTKLNNASDCLNQNVQKGFCEKDANNSFFVTSHGYEDLNIKESN